MGKELSRLWVEQGNGVFQQNMAKGKTATADQLSPLAWGAILAGLTVVAYVPAMFAGYIWDDPDYVVNNPNLRSLDGLAAIWLTPSSSPQYYPLVFTTFWLEYRFWQLDPLGYHVINVVLHAANAIILWRILRLLSVPGAWFAAALFALHPVHVESVAWITERKNTLSGFFYLASALIFLHFSLAAKDKPPPQWRLYGFSFLLFVCALLSKTVTASLPAALGLILWWKQGRISKRHAIALAAMCAIAVPLVWHTAHLEATHVGAKGPEWDFSIIDRCLIAGRVLWFYAGKLLWPNPLTFIYPRWTIDSSAWWQYLFPALALVAVAGLWFFRQRLGRGPLVAILFFAGTLTPALGFVNFYPMRYSFVADHFQYLPSIGILTLMAAAGWQGLRVFQPGHLTRLLALFGVIPLGILTAQQCLVYFNEETLWRDTIAKNSHCEMAHTNLGMLFVEEGHFSEALVQFAIAVELAPTKAFLRNNLATELIRIGKNQQGIYHLRTAVSLEPDYAEAHANLGSLLADQGEPEQALFHLQQAVRLKPKHGLIHYNLGLVLAGKNRRQEAKQSYITALELLPNYAPAHYQLGLLLLGENQPVQAARCFAQTLQIDPNFPNGKQMLKKARSQAASQKTRRREGEN